jgi:hypothetical protein
VQLEVSCRLSFLRRDASEYFRAALRKHCARRACVVIKLALRVRANRT